MEPLPFTSLSAALPVAQTTASLVWPAVRAIGQGLAGAGAIAASSVQGSIPRFVKGAVFAAGAQAGRNYVSTRRRTTYRRSSNRGRLSLRMPSRYGRRSYGRTRRRSYGRRRIGRRRGRFPSRRGRYFFM